MTFQPPPPPPPGNNPPPPPPPPPPGQWGPSAGRAAFDPKTVNPLDWAILALGALLLIFSFFGYYSLSAGPYSDSAGAWHFSGGSFIAWFAMVFGVIGAGVLATELLSPHVKLPWASRLVTLLLFAASSLLFIIAIFVHPKFFNVAGVSFGHGFSFWLSLVMSLAGTVLALMRAQQTGTQLPGALANLPNVGARGPQGGVGGHGPQAGGYGPPPGAYQQPAPPPVGYQQPAPPPAGYQQQPPPPAGYGPPGP